MTRGQTPTRAQTVPTDRALLEKYGPVFESVAEGAAERERDRALPFEQLRELAAAGFGAVRVPVERGGDGATLRQLFLLLIRLATADPHIPQALRGHFAFVEDRLRAADGPDRDRWLRRFAAGELVGNAVTEIGQVEVGRTGTRLEADDDGSWRITGRKYYTTGSIFADWIDASAITPDGAEVAALVATAQDDVLVTDDWDGFGQRLTGSGTAEFRGARVEADQVYDFSNRFPYQTAFYQLTLNAVLAGIAAAAEQDVVAQLRGRSRVFSHGAAPESRNDPQLLETVGRISAAAAAASALTLSAAAVLDEAAAADDPADVTRLKREAELEVSRAQIVVSELALRAATALFDPLGASATASSKALDRHWRNARTVASHNPVAFKARIVGDAAVNDADPPYEWYVGTAAPRPTS
ncbi:acyl-CoA dehydrogenase family protein [Lysobacter korlensis]|uniref:Acyl-CoA dehydrogenase family protein n=1 Tax=Lysobacter korlensis TaxID=553636 RepID=A0ABV6RVW9_9GAMM